MSTKSAVEKPKGAKAMQLAKLVGGKSKVTVHVPVEMQKEHGLRSTATGRVVRVEVVGRLARVTVDLGRGKSLMFRPQDVAI